MKIFLKQNKEIFNLLDISKKGIIHKEDVKISRMKMIYSEKEEIANSLDKIIKGLEERLFDARKKRGEMQVDIKNMRENLNEKEIESEDSFYSF